MLQFSYPTSSLPPGTGLAQIIASGLRSTTAVSGVMYPWRIPGCLIETIYGQMFAAPLLGRVYKHEDVEPFSFCEKRPFKTDFHPPLQPAHNQEFT